MSRALKMKPPFDKERRPKKTEFYGAVDADSWARGITDTAQVLTQTYEINIQTSDKPPTHWSIKEHYGGREATQAFFQRYKNMPAFGFYAANTALSVAQTHGFSNAVIFDIRIERIIVNGDPTFDYSFSVACFD